MQGGPTEPNLQAGTAREQRHAFHWDHTLPNAKWRHFFFKFLFQTYSTQSLLDQPHRGSASCLAEHVDLRIHSVVLSNSTANLGFKKNLNLVTALGFQSFSAADH